MWLYDPKRPVSVALELYFQRTGIDPVVNYGEKWAKIHVAGSLFIFLPNTAQRKKELQIHDLHHVATGYEGTWGGEAQISAWEIGSGGCGTNLYVWLIILAAAFVGLFLCPRDTYKAFALGRKCKNLFSEDATKYLSVKLEDLRIQLNLSVES